MAVACVKACMRWALAYCLFVLPLLSQTAERQTLPTEPGWRPAPQQAQDGSFVLPAGTRIPLVVLRSVSTRNAAPGDQVYLQTLVPVAANRQIVIPPGSYVTATVTQVEQPGKVKGRGQLFVRFDSILFDNGVQMDLNGKLGGLDGDNPGTLSRDEGKVTSQSGAGRDAGTVAATTLGGTAMGSWIGNGGSSAAIGAGAGAAAGLAAILLMKGPDASLPAGSSVEMVLQQDLKIAPDDIPATRGQTPRPPQPQRQKSQQQGFRLPWFGRVPNL